MQLTPKILLLTPKCDPRFCLVIYIILQLQRTAIENSRIDRIDMIDTIYRIYIVLINTNTIDKIDPID